MKLIASKFYFKGEYIMEPMKFKNMLYGARKPGEILAEGEVGIYRFKVISYGSHPCCYVHIPIVHPLYENLDLT
jgi:hypothetical protein